MVSVRFVFLLRWKKGGGGFFCAMERGYLERERGGRGSGSGRRGEREKGRKYYIYMYICILFLFTGPKEDLCVLHRWLGHLLLSMGLRPSGWLHVVVVAVVDLLD